MARRDSFTSRNLRSARLSRTYKISGREIGSDAPGVRLRSTHTRGGGAISRPCAEKHLQPEVCAGIETSSSRPRSSDGIVPRSFRPHGTAQVARFDRDRGSREARDTNREFEQPVGGELVGDDRRSPRGTEIRSTASRASTKPARGISRLQMQSGGPSQRNRAVAVSFGKSSTCLSSSDPRERRAAAGERGFRAPAAGQAAAPWVGAPRPGAGYASSRRSR